MSGGTGRWKPYPAYKDSGVEWLGQVPEGWEVGRVAFGYDVVLGKMLQPTPKNDNEREAPYYRAVNVQWERITGDASEMWATPEEIERFSLREGDLLVCEGGEVGRAAIIDFPIDGPVIIQNALHRVRALAGFSVKFLLRILEHATSADWFSVLCNKATIAHFTGEKFKALKCPFPPLPEQIAITAFLDQQCSQIDSLITNKRRMLDLLDEKRRAIITQAVTRGLAPSTPMKDSGVAWLGQMPAGWEIKQIKRVSPVLRGASPRPIDDPVYFDDNGEFAWVRIADVTSSETFLEKTTQRLSELGANLSVKLESDSLFLSIAGSVGKPCITKIKCCIHDGFVYFPYLNINTKFLFYIFKSGEPYKGLGKMGTQLNLNTDTVGSIKIPIPSPSEQRAIADYLDAQTTALDAQKKNLEKSIDLLREYRASLITHAVTGKIDVRDFVPAR